MSKIDLHCHSKFSEHPSEWFLQRLGAAESYTEPEFIYKEQLSQGMDFVTITDHNRIGGSLLLKEKYPQKVITGVESTVYFPEDDCKTHILVYGLNEKQFEEIGRLRTDIYQFRDYLVQEDLAYSVAHATYSVNGKLNIDHLKKLILLFDVFEAINGGRNKMNNLSWLNVLRDLTPSHIEDLRLQYKIEPISSDPWIKGYTGGSDDHGGIFLGQTYTEADADTPEEFLEILKSRKSVARGRHNTYQALAFTVYKIAMDFSRTKSSKISSSLLAQISDYVFNNKSLNFRNKIKLKASQTKSKNDKKVSDAFSDLVNTLKVEEDKSIDKRFDISFEKISDITDTFFKVLFKTMSKDLAHGNLIKMIRDISSTLPGVFITLPFFTTINHMNKNRNLLIQVQKEFDCLPEKSNKRVLWFTDTYTDLNGVSATMQKVYQYAKANKYPIAIVTNCEGDQFDDANHFSLPIIHEFKLPYYEQLNVKIPSVLKSMEKISKFNPDEIIVSTPGPIGLVGFFAAKLLNIKCRSIYHTDYTAQVSEIKQDESLIKLVDIYSHWFFQKTDEINVTTKTYMDILEAKNIERSKMKIFTRGIDDKLFYPRKYGRVFLKQTYSIKDGVYFIYTGRISEDKNLETVIEAFEELSEEYKDIYLLLVGDGPYRKKLSLHKNHRIIFTGRIERNLLPDYYSGSDVFVFPSTTDTYGMSVVEAQACGIPALVSDVGGPQDLIDNDKTGYVLRGLDVNAWRNKMEEMIIMIKNKDKKIEELKTNSINQAMQMGNWNSFLKEFLDY